MNIIVDGNGKVLLALITFLISCPAFAQVNCVAIGSGYDCSFYGINPNGSPVETSTPYSALVPAGETRPIKIVNASVHAYTNTGSGQHVLLVEAPAGSGKWKLPLCWRDDRVGVICANSLYPGVTLTTADELCLQTYTNSGASYAIHYTIGL